MKKIIGLLFMFLICTGLYCGVIITPEGVEFSYNDPGAGSVSVAGSFNGWNTTANPLKDNGSGLWTAVIDLPEGSHSYKYVVDGNWITDDSNESTIDDGYGGFNSLVEVAGDGTISQKKPAKVKKASLYNPKVYFDARYYVKNDLIKGDLERYSFQKPYHDLNLGVKIALNSQAEAYTMMNINNTVEGSDMWKTHLKFKRTWMKIDADYLSLFAFDSCPYLSFDDPLATIGGEGYYQYGFGSDFRGVQVKTDSNILSIKDLPVSFALEALGADQRGDSERDVAAARAKLGYDFDLMSYDNNLEIGSSIYSNRITGTYDTVVDSMAYSADIVNANEAWEIDAVLNSSYQQEGWTDKMLYQLGFEHYRFQNLMQFKNASDYDYIADEDLLWQDGRKNLLYLDVQFPQALELKVGYQHNELTFYQENYLPGETQIPADDAYEADISRGKLFIATDFELDDFKAGVYFKRWTTDYPDSIITWNDYYRYMERTDGDGRWYQDASELCFANYTLLGYDTGVMWDLYLDYTWKNLELGYQAKIAQYDLGYNPELTENVLEISYNISSHWSLYCNERLPWYNSEFLGLKTDLEGQDLFIDNYLAIIYKPSENLWLSLGYGVNPWVISEVTDEFYCGGRSKYLQEAEELDEYLQNTCNGLGQKIRTAEQKLEDDDRISIEAVIKF